MYLYRKITKSQIVIPVKMYFFLFYRCSNVFCNSIKLLIADLIKHFTIKSVSWYLFVNITILKILYNIISLLDFIICVTENTCSWSYGLRSKRYDANVASPPALIHVPFQPLFTPSAKSITSSG